MKEQVFWLGAAGVFPVSGKLGTFLLFLNQCLDGILEPGSKVGAELGLRLHLMLEHTAPKIIHKQPHSPQIPHFHPPSIPKPPKIPNINPNPKPLAPILTQVKILHLNPKKSQTAAISYNREQLADEALVVLAGQGQAVGQVLFALMQVGQVVQFCVQGWDQGWLFVDCYCCCVVMIDLGYTIPVHANHIRMSASHNQLLQRPQNPANLFLPISHPIPRTMRNHADLLHCYQLVLDIQDVQGQACLGVGFGLGFELGAAGPFAAEIWQLQEWDAAEQGLRACRQLSASQHTIKMLLQFHTLRADNRLIHNNLLNPINLNLHLHLHFNTPLTPIPTAILRRIPIGPQHTYIDPSLTAEQLVLAGDLEAVVNQLEAEVELAVYCFEGGAFCQREVGDLGVGRVEADAGLEGLGMGMRWRIG